MANKINSLAHLANIKSANSQIGTPNWDVYPCVVTSDLVTFWFTTYNNDIDSGQLLLGLQSLYDTSPRYGTNKGFVSNIIQPEASLTISAVTHPGVVTRDNALTIWNTLDAMVMVNPYSIGHEDDLTVVLDQDDQSKRYAINLFRDTKPKAASSYSSTVILRDNDNGMATLGKTFGIDFNFKDFALHMKSRVKSHDSTTSCALWRYYRNGPEGNNSSVRYIYPSIQNSAVNVKVDPTKQPSDIQISLPSGANRTLNVRNTTRVWAIYDNAVTGGGVGTNMNAVILNTGLPIISLDRSGSGPYTVTAVIAPAIGTTTGIQVGDNIYIQIGDAAPLVDFSSGLKIITGVTYDGVTHHTSITWSESSGTVITYTGLTNTWAVGDPAGDLTWSGISQYDVVYLDQRSGIHASFCNKPMLVLQNPYSNSHSMLLCTDTSVGGDGTTPLPTADVMQFSPQIQQASYINAYPINSATNTVDDIVAAVNAIPNAPISGVAIGSGGITGGQIQYSTHDELQALSAYDLVDGVNYIKSISAIDTDVNSPTYGEYTFLLKNTINSGLATGSDCQFYNEDIKLIPQNATGIVDYLNVAAISGLSVEGEVRYTKNGHIQLSTSTPGSSGSVQVQGGTANKVLGSIVGSSSLVDSGAQILSTISVADTKGLFGDIYVSLTNTNVMPKNLLTSSYVLSAISASSKQITFNGSSPIRVQNSVTGAHQYFVEKHGKFVAYRWDGLSTSPDISSFVEGDWINITSSGTGGYPTGSTVNQGLFTIVRADTTNKVFWIENADAIEETAQFDLVRTSFDSIMPGDKFVISTPVFNIDNINTYTVQTVVDDYNFTVLPAPGSDYSGSSTLGSNLGLVQVIEKAPSRRIKKIISISPNTIDPANFTDIKFDTTPGYRNISSLAGTAIQALDKLDFSTDLIQGVDGYQYSTGLIGEANKVIYGDEADPVTYPGIAAAGANINIAGPLVKRVSISLEIRVRSGVSTSDVINKVQSAVASVVNKTDVGTSIAISDIITAAGSVAGVLAVTILSPTFSVGNDLITVQPYEKPLIINLDTDVLVSITGA